MKVLSNPSIQVPSSLPHVPPRTAITLELVNNFRGETRGHRVLIHENVTSFVRAISGLNFDITKTFVEILNFATEKFFVIANVGKPNKAVLASCSILRLALSESLSPTCVLILKIKESSKLLKQKC